MPALNTFTSRPKIAVLVPKEKRDLTFPSIVKDALAEFAEPLILPDDTLANADLAPFLKDVPAVITGWQSPAIPAEALAPKGSIGFVSHMAGSVRKLGVQDGLEKGELRVSHAAPVIAYAVAEFALTQMLAHLRRHRDFDQGFRNGTAWFDMRENYLGQLLSAQPVGIVGLGYVGRLVLDLLRPFGCPIYVYDPFLSKQDAAALGVTLLGLDALFETCSVISLHAPNLPVTEGMVTRKHLKSLCDGGLLVNTARAGILEKGALVDELKTGRIFAALDTFESEPPLGADMTPQMRAELSALSNAYLSPHAAGHTSDSYVRQGLTAVEEVRRYLSGQPLEQEILREKAAAMA